MVRLPFETQSAADLRVTTLLFPFSASFSDLCPMTIRKSVPHFLAMLLLVSAFPVHAQLRVAITMDDVPNTLYYAQSGYRTRLPDRLDSLNIPLAIFVNEGKIYVTDSVARNFALLDRWAKAKYITLGNHSFSHFRCSDMPVDVFGHDVEKGEYITRQLAHKYRKSLQYFRFPFNDLGKDSTRQADIRTFLEERKYRIMPFTIETSDYLFSDVYAYYLAKNDKTNAALIGKEYVEKTLHFFSYFDFLSQQLYGRSIPQIYLCHDNVLNADYLPELLKQLQEKGYIFNSIDDVLQDPVYRQENRYYQHWGISWLYRWIGDKKERMRHMKAEPSLSHIEQLYEKIIQESKN